MELVSSVKTRAQAVMNALLRATRGKSVSVQASATLAHRTSVGSPKPLPPSWSGVFSAVTTVKYKGTRTDSESRISTPVSHQLIW